MPVILRIVLCVVVVFALTGYGAAIDWPVSPGDISYPIGNSYGEFQHYDGRPYFHPGIDIMVPAGTPVYAVEAGYVKAVLTICEKYHWRVAVGDSAGAAECDGWLYAHLSEASIAVNEGDRIKKGQYLGDVIGWPVADFHHLHFVKIRHSGETWNADWQFIGNPLDELDVIDDPDAPVFEEIEAGRAFAFCQNESSSYFAPGQPLSGEVDVICRVYDYVNHRDWKLMPYRIEYRIAGDDNVPWTESFRFTGPLDHENCVGIIYKQDRRWRSRGDYDDREFYVVLTNSDGDGVIEAGDRKRSWRTADFHNGEYTVYARAYDRAGNVTVDSAAVSVVNYFTLAGSIGYDDGNEHLGGTVVSILPDGDVDTTDEAGGFSLSMVGGGSQTVRITREGYRPIDTVLVMNRHHRLELAMKPFEYVSGDANGDGLVNAGDPVFLISYIFGHGAYPALRGRGDANGDGRINAGDAVYLIRYLLNDGRPPEDTGRTSAVVAR